MAEGAEPSWGGEAARRAVVAGALGVGMTALALLAWLAADVLLVAFAASLVAIGMRGVADGLARWMRVPPVGALGVTVLALVLLTAIAMRYLVPEVASQIAEIATVLPGSLQQLETFIERGPWWPRGFGELELSGLAGEGSRFLLRATGLLAQVALALTVFVLVIVIGLLAAVSPGLYVGGFVRLFPKGRRARVREVVAAVGHTLRWWLLGRGAAMAVVGVLTSAGLWFFDVPLALGLGVICGLSSFVPNIGFFLAGMLVLLFAASQGTTTLLQATAVFLVVQGVESYVLVPMVEHRAVHVPPSLNMPAQLLMAILFGALGLILSAPLVAVAFVLAQKVYLEDVLGDRGDGADGGDGGDGADGG